MITKDYTIIPKSGHVRFDVMVGGRFRCQIMMALTPGIEYGYDELVQYARIKRPSLGGVSFDLVPTAQRI